MKKPLSFIALLVALYWAAFGTVAWLSSYMFNYPLFGY